MNLMQLPLCAPKVEWFMLKPEYWIERTREAEELILNREGINKLNEESFRQMKSKGFEEWLCNLEKYPKKITKEKLLNTMKTYSSKAVFPKKPCYDVSANEISETVKKEVLYQANFDGISDEISVELGMLIKREDVMAFPTNIVFAEKPETINLNLFQLTILPVGSPVAILHKSKNRKWYYVQSTICKGWIKAENIALARNKKEVFDYLKTDKFLVVTESRVETEPNPFIKEVSNILFQMGNRIPLFEFNKIPYSITISNLHAQFAEGRYVVKIPVKDEEGHLEFRLALIARSNDICEGYLPYTRGNIIQQAFKLLGERYGWGGMFKRRDCAQFIMDIYRTMNIVIPYSTKMQEEGAFGKSIKFTGSIEKREDILNKLQPGDPIYLKGHVVMYLGQVGENHYIIHSGYGYGTKNKDGSIRPVSVYGVFITEVHQLLRNGEKSYLEAFTTARKFE